MTSSQHSCAPDSHLVCLSLPEAAGLEDHQRLHAHETNLSQKGIWNLRQATAHPNHAPATTQNHSTQADTSNHERALSPSSHKQPQATFNPNNHRQPQATSQPLYDSHHDIHNHYRCCHHNCCNYNFAPTVDPRRQRSTTQKEPSAPQAGALAEEKVFWRWRCWWLWHQAPLRVGMLKSSASARRRFATRRQPTVANDAVGFAMAMN